MAVCTYACGVPASQLLDRLRGNAGEVRRVVQDVLPSIITLKARQLLPLI